MCFGPYLDVPVFAPASDTWVGPCGNIVICDAGKKEALYTWRLLLWSSSSPSRESASLIEPPTACQARLRDRDPYRLLCGLRELLSIVVCDGDRCGQRDGRAQRFEEPDPQPLSRLAVLGQPGA